MRAFVAFLGPQVSAAYALTEGDASGPAQTLLAADTESDSDPDSGIATLPDLTEEHPVTLQPDEEPAPSDDASSGTQVVYYADPSDPDKPGDADTDVEIDPDGVDFGRYITKSEAQWRKNKNDSWHSWDELAGGALGYGDGLKFRLEYTLPTGSLWKNGAGQPDTIIFYQLPETLKNFTGSDKVYADHVAVGEYEIRDGVVTIHFTDNNYIAQSKESDIEGTIELSGTVSQLKADDNGKVELNFNKDVRFEMTVKPKPVDLSIVKKGIQKDVANNKITYQVTVSTEEGTQGTPVLLHDALQLNLGKALVGAKYDENSLKVSLDVEKNGNDKIYENTAPEGETANGWSVKTAAEGKSFDLTLPALEAGESYTISGLISKSGEWHTDHTITWTVKLNQNNADLTGTVLRDFFGGTDEANELKNQEAKMKRVAAKLGDRYQKEGIGVEENGDTLTLNWELILNPVRAQNGWPLKDGQYLTAEQKNDLKTKLEALPGFGTGTVTFGADGKSFTAKGTGEWPANRQERITYSSTWDRDTSTVKGYAFTNAATFENYTVTGTNYYHEGTVVQKLDVSTGETETGGTTNHEYHELKNGKLVWNVVITMSDKMKKAASFTITENLPEGVKLEGLTFKQGDFFTGDVKFQSNEEGTSWTASADGALVTAEVAEDGKIELTVPQAVYNNPDLRNKTITLEVTVTPVNVAEWEHDTTHRFRNSVTVTSSTLPEGGYTAFQEQDIFYNQNYNAIAKTGKKLDNALNQVQYQIVVNPDGVTFLDGKERLKLVDTLTRPDGMKIFLEDSKLKVYDYTDGTKGEELGLDEYSYTYEEKEGENVLTFHLPDGRPLLVEYVYRGDGEVNKTFTLTNHAVLSGTSSQGTSSGSDYEMKVQNSSASVKLSGVSLYKVDSSNYGKRLQGATFRLEKWVWNNAEKTGSWETVLDRVTSDENGLLKTVDSDNRNLLQTGVAYRMVELEAPHGYELRMEPFDFYIDTEPANTPKDYAGQLCFTGQRVFIPNTRGYYDPQLTKNILESGSPVKRNNAKPGETVQFQTAIQVAHGQPSKYVLHDAMSGLNFDAASLKITRPVGDESGKQIEQTLKENIDYTLKKDCEDGCAFEITFSDERLTPGDLLTLTYSATVREDAVVEGEGNPNTTWLEYADPTGSSTTGEEETRTVVPEEPKVPEQPSEPKQPPVIPTPIDPSEVPEEPAGSDSREEPPASSGETQPEQPASSELPASPDDSLRPGAPGPDNQDGWVLGAHGTAGNPAAEAPADSTAAAPMPDNHKNKVMGAVDSLIQTGQLNWPIPVLLTLGGALVLAGLVLTRRKNRR